MAELAAKAVRMVHISTDYVFDGERWEAYTEQDEASSRSATMGLQAGGGAGR